MACYPCGYVKSYQLRELFPYCLGLTILAFEIRFPFLKSPRYIWRQIEKRAQYLYHQMNI